MSLINKMFSESMPGLEKALDLAWRRSQAITSNIANAETPGYRAVDYNFGTELDRAFNSNKGEEVLKTNSKHLDVNSGGGARLVEDFSGATKADGNNVDIDVMVARMQRNQGLFTETAGIVRRQLRFISNAIKGADR